MDIQELLSTIDTSKMERSHTFIDIYDMCEREFGIYEYLNQKTPRLTHCYFHSWICTDTTVGIKVWYLDNIPVCVSFKPYRKAAECYMWLSNKCFETTREYVISLINEPEYQIELLTDEYLSKSIENFETIEYKKFETKNIK